MSYPILFVGQCTLEGNKDQRQGVGRISLQALFGIPCVYHFFGNYLSTTIVIAITEGMVSKD